MPKPTYLKSASCLWIILADICLTYFYKKQLYSILPSVMTLSQVFLAIIVCNIVASSLYDPIKYFIIAERVGNANIAKYVEREMNRDITDWLAIGDSFSAGITADVPADRLNWYVITAPAS